MITKSIKSIAIAMLWACWTVSMSSVGTSQALFEVTPTLEIPHDYKSWSLFLICNPAWIYENGDKGIAELFNQYRAFGRAIGPTNLAIWFWRKPATMATADNTDIERGSGYCEKYKLMPSESPHVLVTTRYPDDSNLGEHFIIRLNGLNAHDSALALTKLADQLIVTGLEQPGLDTNIMWRKVYTAIGSAVGATGCYFNKVSFSLKTGVINAEIGHATEGTGAGC